VFEKDEPVMWQCSNCGHQVFGAKAPDLCPYVRTPSATSRSGGKTIDPT
jgi:rubrerythrin